MNRIGNLVMAPFVLVTGLILLATVMPIMFIENLINNRWLH